MRNRRRASAFTVSGWRCSLMPIASIRFRRPGVKLLRSHAKPYAAAMKTGQTIKIPYHWSMAAGVSYPRHAVAKRLVARRRSSANRHRNGAGLGRNRWQRIKAALLARRQAKSLRNRDTPSEHARQMAHLISATCCRPAVSTMLWRSAARESRVRRRVDLEQCYAASKWMCRFTWVY